MGQREGTVLTKVKASITDETNVERRNVPVFGSTELLPMELVTEVEKLNRALHDEVIRMAITFEKKPSQQVKQNPSFCSVPV